MRILVIGSGGREHALAWKLAQSPAVEALYVAPGNPGTAALAENLPVRAEDSDGLLEAADEHRIDLTVVGPEAPLAAGIVDRFNAAGRAIFGPTRAAARLESDKRFAKDLMARCGIPTAAYRSFTRFEGAWAYARAQRYPLVVKAAGLAAGKGVIICATPEEAEEALRRTMVAREFGAAGDEVVVEEFLQGQEASVLALSDGRTVRTMPVAQDHKALLEGDRGPNTGGMGAYAPAGLITPALLAQVQGTILQPAVDALWAEGIPYRGVLYAGLMLTAQGPKVLEFNARFGDPETQVILPLLASDLLPALASCLDGSLARADLRWSGRHALCVVLAAGGYPGHYEKSVPIAGLDSRAEAPETIVFQAGTACMDGQVVTAGGRVLGVTGLGDTLAQAAERAYGRVETIRFAGMTYRRDIGAKAMGSPHEFPRGGIHMAKSDAYRAAGVDIDAGARAVELMRGAVQATHGPEVLAGIGAFGGLFDAAGLCGLEQPVLVASTDGVGTKTRLAMQLGLVDGLGEDIVNHCINDILVQGARPLFFLDYVAMPRLDPQIVARIVTGAAKACRAAGCALLGGETAEMPGVYAAGELDLVGTIVGWVERSKIIDGAAIRPGDVAIGLASSGLHTNGFSLARRVLEGLPLTDVYPALGRTLGEALLVPHRSYLSAIERLWDAGVAVKGLAHITGGGFFENVPRILPAGVAARIDAAAWPAPPLFRLIEERGGIERDEMYRVFNMGVGMVVFVAPGEAETALAAAGQEAWVIGEAVAQAGEERVRLG